MDGFSSFLEKAAEVATMLIAEYLAQLRLNSNQFQGHLKARDAANPLEAVLRVWYCFAAAPLQKSIPEESRLEQLQWQ